MKCFTLSYLRWLVVFCCFVCLQYTSFADEPPTAPAGYAYYTTYSNGGYDTLNAPRGCKLYFTVGSYWVDNAGDWNEPCLYSNYRGADNNPTSPCWITLPAGNYLIATDLSQQCFVYLYEAPDPPSLSDGCTLNAKQGQQFSYDLSNSKLSGTEPITYTTTSLPSWLSRSGNVISGTVPNDAQGFEFDINASNSAGSAPTPSHVVVTVASGVAPVITNQTDYYFEVGQEYTFTANVTGDEPMTIIMSDYPSWVIKTAPDTLKFTIPLGYPDFTIKIKASNAFGTTDPPKTCIIHVNGSSTPTAVTVTNFKDLNNVEVLQQMELHLSNIDDATSASADHLNNIDNNVITVLERLDTIITLLQQASSGSSTGSFSGDGTLTLPDMELEDFGDHTTGYTDDQVKDKTKLNQFNFIKQKLEHLKGVQPGGTMRFELPVTSLGFAENPYIILSENDCITPYITACRRFFSIIIYIAGVLWWLQIIMGFFV
jgi:hypothetical protein